MCARKYKMPQRFFVFDVLLNDAKCQWFDLEPHTSIARRVSFMPHMRWICYATIQTEIIYAARFEFSQLLITLTIQSIFVLVFGLHVAIRVLYAWRIRSEPVNVARFIFRGNRNQTLAYIDAYARHSPFIIRHSSLRFILIEIIENERRSSIQFQVDTITLYC